MTRKNRLTPLYLIGLLFFVAACKTQKVSSTSSSPDSKVPEKDPKPAWVSKASKYDYQPSETRLTDLIHTKLEVAFDWEKQYLLGTATLTLSPYFYDRDSLILDAKGFDIHKLQLEKGEDLQDLSFVYDSLKLRIALDRVYSRDEQYTVRIEYTAKPNELKEGGSDAITSDKGLYFINPTGEDGDKPRQIWTQGETESSSCWFPTIDAPNEKTTQDIYITVDTTFVTLSNGTLVFTKINEDNTKTEYWRMDQPHAPYLFMMVVGEFAKITDTWNDMEVSYYVEKEYEPYARAIFGHTPEMLEFFSNKFGYKYPWDKYSQIAVRDYVSGAMENTTASIFLEQIQLNDRELEDKDWDYIIAHELSHHWFGDLVTCESWSNLALNESFANYSEYLWFEYKFGRDEADFHADKELVEYLDEARYKQEPIVRFHYNKREDMFDRHSYNKGGRVLHMLRKYVGDEAFFASLQDYLKTNEYEPAEMHQLRLSFEKITGEDLNWFFNEWFYSPGHPQLIVNHDYANGYVTLNVEQKQMLEYTPLFKIPIKVAIWTNGEEELHEIIISDTTQSFKFPASERPSLVLFDAEQVVLGEVVEIKPKEQLVFQYDYSPRYFARKNALLGLTAIPFDTVVVEEGLKLVAKKGIYNPRLNEPEVFDVLKRALDDDFWAIRLQAIDTLMGYNGSRLSEILTPIKRIAQEDTKSATRAKALQFLANVEGEQASFLPIYQKGLDAKSYLVVAASLEGYLKSGATGLEEKIQELKEIDNPNIVKGVTDYFISVKDQGQYEWLATIYKKANPYEKYELLEYFAGYLNIATPTDQQKGKKLLVDDAMNHENIYARFSAYKALFILSQVIESSVEREAIRAKETDERLQRAYKRIEGIE